MKCTAEGGRENFCKTDDEADADDDSNGDDDPYKFWLKASKIIKGFLTCQVFRIPTHAHMAGPDGKKVIDLTLCGADGSGQSTFLTNLIYSLGGIPDREM